MLEITPVSAIVRVMVPCLIRLILPLAALSLAACGSGGTQATSRSPSGTSPSGHTAPSVERPLSDESGSTVAATDVPEAPPSIPCDTDEIPLYADGEQDGTVCPRDAQALGVTLIDMSEHWTPFIFSEGAEGGHQPYRPVFLALAEERLGDVPDGYDEERYLELFGIFPTFRVVLARLADEERHTCHAAVDNRWLERQDAVVRAWRPTQTEQRRSVRRARSFAQRLTRAAEHEVEQTRAAGETAVTPGTPEDAAAITIDSLEDHPVHGGLYSRYAEAQTQVGAVEAAQEHLRCDALLNTRRRVRPGVLGSWTAAGLRDYQRRHMVVSAGFLDEETRLALAKDSRQADFETLLRVLRERVVDATGLIEDGSAGHAWSNVLGLELDAPQFHFEAGREAAPNPAPDLISAATEAAALALGLSSPEVAADQLRLLTELPARQIAVRLPPLPAYHSAHMAIRAEIDRGDVFYHYPYRDDGRSIGGRVELRPIITLYVEHEGEQIALLRWPTTIGGWKPETRSDGSVGLRYKNSPTGARVWRDVIVSPTWLPPPSTPDEELVRRTRNGWVPRRSIFGPGYRSAYGLVMMMHHLVQPPRTEGGEPRFLDEGIRVHGSVSYRSITRGYSHGCHRLYNHLAVRISSFVLGHRNRARRGHVPASYRREVVIHGDDEQSADVDPLVPNSLVVDPSPHVEARVDVEIDTRGYLFELTPPVPIEVLEGRVRGRRNRPIDGFRLLPEELVQAVQADAAEDGR